MKIRPLHDRVLVKRLEEERKTASGIVIPDTAAEKPDQGEIMAIGKGRILENGKVRPLDIKIGDRILFGKYSGQTVRVKGDELLVITQQGMILRMLTDDVRAIGRATQGVTIINIEDEDKVVSIARLVEKEEEEPAADAE